MADSDRAAREDEARKQTAQKGEDQAAHFLRANGWHILETNWYCRGGELDIIAEKDDVIAFVEVRTAAAWKGRRPEDSVRGIKQHRVVKAAQKWISQTDKPVSRRVLRFDVIGVEVGANGATELRHYPHAFTGKLLI